MERTATFVSAASRCVYLRDRMSRLRYDLMPDLQPAEFMDRLRDGWRRFGYAVFRPECPGCSMCQSLRVAAATFQPTAGQRRVWRKNQDITLRTGEPEITRERVALWHAFHRHGYETKAWPVDYAPAPELMLQSPFPIEEWTYRLGDRLVGVGYVDALPEGLSAIYFYWDPVEQGRSLGTFNILTLMAAARARGLPHVYLGYYVRGCRSLEYKARFGPHEVLGHDRQWRAGR